MKNNKRAFIFDMDGTLIDSMPFHYRAWLDTFHKLGVDISEDQLKQANLGVISEVIRRLLGDAQNIAIHAGHPRELPVAGELFDHPVDGGALFLHPVHQTVEK